MCQEAKRTRFAPHQLSNSTSTDMVEEMIKKSKHTILQMNWQNWEYSKKNMTFWTSLTLLSSDKVDPILKSCDWAFLMCGDNKGDYLGWRLKSKDRRGSDNNLSDIDQIFTKISLQYGEKTSDIKHINRYRIFLLTIFMILLKLWSTNIKWCLWIGPKIHVLSFHSLVNSFLPDRIKT